jgi:hypothetical protein
VGKGKENKNATTSFVGLFACFFFESLWGYQQSNIAMLSFFSLSVSFSRERMSIEENREGERERKKTWFFRSNHIYIP